MKTILIIFLFALGFFDFSDLLIYILMQSMAYPFSLYGILTANPFKKDKLNLAVDTFDDLFNDPTIIGETNDPEWPVSFTIIDETLLFKNIDDLTNFIYSDKSELKFGYMVHNIVLWDGFFKKLEGFDNPTKAAIIIEFILEMTPVQFDFKNDDVLFIVIDNKFYNVKNFVEAVELLLNHKL